LTEKQTSEKPIVTVRFLLLAGLLLGVNSTTPAAAPNPTAGKPNQATISLSAQGLKANSPRQFAVYRKTLCLGKPYAGRPFAVAPGMYQVRVGFPSGWLAQDVELKPGQQYVIPTGLFTFKQLTAPSLPTTVPQKLYQGNTYLATGYQGRTARLLPGKYQVYYHDPNEEKPAVAFGPWHVLGVFPNPQKPKPHAGFNTKYPPEDQPIPDLAKTYKQGEYNLAWKPLANDGPSVNLVDSHPYWGIAYATAAIESDRPQRAQLILSFYGGVKVWLNGKLIKTVPVSRRSYIITQTSDFVQLIKGRNVLFVKIPRAYTYWDLSAVAVRWKMYEAEVQIAN